MAQRLTESFINTSRPGAYFDVKTKSTPVGVATSGNIYIFGEATGGPSLKSIDPTDGVDLKDNWYTPDQADQVQNTYISGPIVDAFRAMTAASSDDNITGSPNRIYIGKTNVSAKAQATVASAYGTIKDRNWGKDGNKYKYQVTQSVEEAAPTITGTVIGSFGATLDAATFDIRIDGGAEATVTLGTGGHADIGTLVTELNGLLPSGITASEGTASDSLKLEYDADVSANTKGYGKSFELIETNAGDLALLGHAEGTTISSAEPEVQLDITRQDISLNESFNISADIAFTIGYEGTTATATITDTALTTTVTGGAGANLTLDLADYTTLRDLADYINSQTGYTAEAVSEYSQKSPTELDDVTAAGICSTGAGEQPGRIKRAAKAFSDTANTSARLSFTATATSGLPDAMTVPEFLSGGDTGSTSSANIISALTAAEAINVNFVLPLFSRDAADDITDSLTDSASTYSIDSIHAATKNHVLKMSTAKIKRHRQGALSYWGTYAESKTKAGTAANARLTMTMQRSSQVDSAGATTSFLPWHTSAIAVGMQTAGFYKAIIGKFANVITFEDPTGFDSGNPGQIEDAIESGLLFLEKLITGNVWTSDQTTYGRDTNFVYNSMQAMYTGDLVSLDLTAAFQRAFVGQSLADVSAATGISFIASKMDAYRKQKLIAPSADAPLGFKDPKVTITAPVMRVSVGIKLATAILFVPINIEFSQVELAA